MPLTVVRVLVRTWNLSRGAAVPASRRRYVREMVELAAADGPTVVCLQELTARALGRIAEWAEMRSVSVRTRRGQGNAILLASEARIRETKILTLNTNPYVEEQGRALGLEAKLVRRWERERRVCQLVKIELPDRRRLLVANLRTTAADPRLADAELRRAMRFVERAAELEEIVVVAGGWAEPIHVSNGRIVSTRTWTDDERTYGGRLLSAHAPVDAIVEPAR
jgi:endonuclease/exonuclease/phosphatase family metal-dependent hydrolase